ncbi:hypothetical protein [Epibacterium ulvae]|uniref:hypothetical protein n=1 Tax=Epibacterium ulvae TaxID=1156985 RepID=UPI002490BF7A|nr:hypothetical protein [Epibacterium ulvae]
MRARELLELAINWLKLEYPTAIIVTEMSVDDWGGARIDVAAITDEEMIGVEIKGEGDSPMRLDLQGLVYGRVARKMWLLPTPDGTLAERCAKKKPNSWGTLEIHQGAVRPKNVARKLGEIEKTDYGTRQGYVPDPDTYKPDKAMWSMRQCPWAMCGTLWRDELYEIARLHSVEVKGRALVGPLTDAICEQLPVPKLHDAMIDQLRRREWRKPVIDLRGQKQGIMI